ncbi:MAG: hypothetical protein H6739_16565 [Alphaproteobacteria bacterium]|nr:hypothetical protein [Alphaproteobacteria bacterium]
MIAALLLLGCQPYPGGVAPEDVIALEICPTDAPCTPRADGVSQVTVRACVPTDTVPLRKDELEMTLELSGGEWISGSSDGVTLTELVDEDPCVDTAAITPVHDEQLRVTATVEGVRLSQVLGLSPAEIGDVQLSPSTYTLDAAGPNQLTVSVEVFSPSAGPVSNGTTIDFQVVAAEPAETGYTLWPDHAILDDGVGAVTLVTSGGLDSLTLRATATPPDWAGATLTVAPVSAELELLGE